MLDHITPLILTKNEEANLERTLSRLGWAHEVVIVDSLSDDATVAIARKFPNVRLIQRPLDTHAAQWQFGLGQVGTTWALTLDADYFVPDDFVAELASLQPPPNVSAYVARFIYAVRGKRLRASLYPPREVLLRVAASSFWQDGHTQRTRVDGAVATLTARLIHDDRKSFRRFLERQRRYMKQEAEKLRTADRGTLNAAARIRKLIVIAPFAVVIHTLFVKRTLLDGWPGIYYAFERFVAELMLSRELLRR
ncbi:MAG TPA: glycosyltransferase family 2 protein [Thermoanaerobaculia bacterium]|jgi:glycosyltransferase involved in cell wall biosynthesis